MYRGVQWLKYYKLYVLCDDGKSLKMILKYVLKFFYFCLKLCLTLFHYLSGSSENNTALLCNSMYNNRRVVKT